MRRLLTALLLLCLLAGGAPAHGQDASGAGDPSGGPESGTATPEPSVQDVAAGWLARQITAEGAVADAASDSDVSAAATAALALRHAGWGVTAVERIDARIVAVATDRGVADLTTTELALATMAVVAGGDDPRALGQDALDLIDAILQREQESGPDQGLYGVRSLLDNPVVAQSLALRALRAADQPVSDEAVTWLRGQQCPGRGWPTYRDPASRPTETCEVLAPTMTATRHATLTLDQLSLLDEPGVVQNTEQNAEQNGERQTGPGLSEQGTETIADGVRAHLRESRHESGGYTPAIGLRPTPLATAEALRLMPLVGVDPESPSWTGSEGSPMDVLTAEQHGCDQEATRRGAWPTTNRQTSSPPTGPDGEPAEESPPDVAQASMVAQIVSLLHSPSAGLEQGDPFPPCPVTITRHSGTDRIATSIELSAAAFPDGAGAVIIATAAGYADALSASAVAGALQGPMLLSWPASASEELLAEVTRLGPTEIVLMGGEQALSAEVADALAMIDGVQEVRRIAGRTRVETAALAAGEIDADTVFIARADGEGAPWADALAVGAWAAASQIPVLLSGRASLPEVTAEALADVDRAIIVGGDAALSGVVEDAVRELVPDTTRLAGDDRVHTAAIVFERARTEGLSATAVLIVTAADFPDALSAGPAAAAMDGLLLLVDPHAGVAGPVVDALVSADHLVDAIALVGGTTAVADEVGTDAAIIVRSGAGG